MVNSIWTYKALLMYKQGIDEQIRKWTKTNKDRHCFCWGTTESEAVGLSLKSFSHAALIHKSFRVHLVKLNLPITWVGKQGEGDITCDISLTPLCAIEQCEGQQKTTASFEVFFFSPFKLFLKCYRIIHLKTLFSPLEGKVTVSQHCNRKL